MKLNQLVFINLKFNQNILKNIIITYNRNDQYFIFDLLIQI